jgi:hypothetical protein
VDRRYRTGHDVDGRRIVDVVLTLLVVALVVLGVTLLVRGFGPVEPPGVQAGTTATAAASAGR